MPAGEKFEKAVAIMARLRAPGGCPWDREQTYDSIKPFTIEETYEVIDAIDRRDWNELKGELGDLLLQVLFYAQMAEEDGHFQISDVLDRLSEKLIRRHPHVFGEVKAETSREVLTNWEAIKAEERKATAPASSMADDPLLLASVSRSMPALLEASKISHKAANVGFDWPNIHGLFEKLEEEVAELKAEIKHYPAPGPSPQARGVAGAKGKNVPEALQQRLEDEMGDMFFVLVNIARYLSLDPESALRKANTKFRRRFDQVESALRSQGKRLEDSSIEEMEALWQRSKQQEKRQ